MVIRDYEYDNYTFLCAVAEGSKMISGQLHELWTAPNAELSCATVLIQVKTLGFSLGVACDS